MVIVPAPVVWSGTTTVAEAAAAIGSLASEATAITTSRSPVGTVSLAVTVVNEPEASAKMLLDFKTRLTSHLLG